MSKLVRGVEVWGRDGALSSHFVGGDDPRRSAPDSLLEANVARALRGERFEVSHERANETYQVAFAPLIDESGQRAGAVSVTIDTSVRHRIEGALRERLAFQEMVNGLSTQFVSLGVDEVDRGVDDALRALGEFAAVDRAYVFRFRSDGVAMDNTHEWCAEGIPPAIDMLQNCPLDAFPWWMKHLRAMEVVNVPDVSALPPDADVERHILGEQGVLSVLAIPLVFEGALVGFMGFDSVAHARTWPSSDVTLLRIASEIIVSSLERKRAEQSRRVLEAQLAQARSLESIARLAGGVAHDFNNLLAIILNYASLLRRELTDPRQHEKISELFDAAQRAADLTRQLLLTGRRDVVEPMLLDLSEVVRSLDALVREAAGDDVDVRLDLSADIGLVRIGLPQLEQVVLNLVVNARDALPSGGTVVIATSEVMVDEAHAARFIAVKPGSFLRLRVTDNGIGMAPEVASRAFEPFFSTKEKKGTGLGLSTVYGIVEQARGHIALVSEPGKGTTVDVYLPVVREGVPADIRPAPKDEAPLGHGETVLVVEDSPAVRRLVCDMLEANGYTTLSAPAGQGALDTLNKEAERVDLLLTDVILPQMSGRDLAARAREQFGIERVLFMSGYDDEVIVHQGFLEPKTQLLQKPFLEADLLRAVRRALDARA